MAHSFAQDQFGKPINQITADDLITYFSTERDESLTLEFKSFYQHENDIKHKENGVLRTICGFLNSNGGLAIWGAPVGRKNEAGQKVFMGELSPVEKRYSRDDFISKISNRIIPFAAPVQFQPIETSPDKFVYLIDVPESTAKPHQFDNSYYMRLDGQTKPAPHYIIDALFKQVRLPELEGYLRITGYELVRLGGYDDDVIKMSFDATVFNMSRNTNDEGVYIQLVAVPGVFERNSSSNYLFNEGIVFVNNASPVITYGMPTQCSFVYNLKYNEYSNLRHDRKDIEIMMFFGSKLSHTRRSDYTIRIKVDNYAGVFNRQFTDPVDLEIILTTTKKENISVNDVWKGSDQDRIKMALRGI